MRKNLSPLFLFVLLSVSLWEVARGGIATAEAQVVAHPFHNAIRLQDFAEARSLLEQRGRNLLTETDSFGMLPLHSAAALGSLEAVRFLLEEGVDAIHPPQNGYSDLVRGRSPLHLAVATGNTQLVNLLVESGADVFARDNAGVTPLHLAVQYGRIRVATTLIDFSRKLSHTGDKNGTTPLHLAARHGRGIIITRLLFLDDLDDKEKPTLGGRLQKLLVGESFLDQQTGFSKSFDQRWRTEVVNVQNNFGLSPLHYAAAGGHEDVLELLIENGAHTNVSNRLGVTPLFMAARDNRKGIVSFLLSEKSIKTDTKNLEGMTALTVALANGNGDISNMLLQHDFDARLQDKTSKTVLHHAARGGEIKALRIVLKKAVADINSVDNLGNSPLHYATQAGKTEAVKELLRAGADIAKRNKRNETAQDIAKKLGNAEVLSILR